MPFIEIAIRQFNWSIYGLLLSVEVDEVFDGQGIAIHAEPAYGTQAF